MAIKLKSLRQSQESGVFETEVDNVSGNVIQRVWEWK